MPAREGSLRESGDVGLQREPERDAGLQRGGHCGDIARRSLALISQQTLQAMQ
jgi:hypothetical protein